MGEPGKSFIRIFHPDHYDRDRQRWKSLVFKNYDNGISVVDRDCVDLTTKHSICGHIREFYSTVHGEPIIFWDIPGRCIDEIKESGGELINTASDSGDSCHFDIIKTKDTKAKALLKKFLNEQELKACASDEEVTFNIQLLK